MAGGGGGPCWEVVEICPLRWGGRILLMAGHSQNEKSVLPSAPQARPPPHGRNSWRAAWRCGSPGLKQDTGKKVSEERGQTKPRPLLGSVFLQV